MSRPRAGGISARIGWKEMAEKLFSDETLTAADFEAALSVGTREAVEDKPP